jgi:hypothetical protein
MARVLREDPIRSGSVIVRGFAPDTPTFPRLPTLRSGSLE